MNRLKLLSNKLLCNKLHPRNNRPNNQEIFDNTQTLAPMNKNDSTVICIYYRYSINKLTSIHNNILLSGIFVNLGVGKGLHVFKITTPL